LPEKVVVAASWLMVEMVARYGRTR